MRKNVVGFKTLFQKEIRALHVAWVNMFPACYRRTGTAGDVDITVHVSWEPRPLCRPDHSSNAWRIVEKIFWLAR